MRIALLSFEYPPETGFGGIGSYTWHHARGLARLGHEVHVLTGARQAMALRSTEQDGVLVHRYWADGWLMRGAASLGRLQWWWTRQRLQNAWSMARGLASLRRQYRFDVVEMPECGGEGAWLTARRHALPSVVRLHSPAQLIMPFYDVRPGDQRACSAIERQALRRARQVTACSAFVADATRSSIGLHQAPTVISNGLDLAWFDARTAEGDDQVLARLGLPRQRPMVLFTGRLERRKGIALCGAIAAELLVRHDVSLVLAGDDLFGHFQRDVMPALAGRTLRGQVVALGHRPAADIRALVRQCTVFLLPSLWENCPYACLEAMAAGRAVVAARQGGMPEIIQHGVNGLLASAGDAGSFARHIGTLLDDPAQRARLGGEARRTVEQHHRHTHTATRTLPVYQAAQNPGTDR